MARSIGKRIRRLTAQLAAIFRNGAGVFDESNVSNAAWLMKVHFGADSCVIGRGTTPEDMTVAAVWGEKAIPARDIMLTSVCMKVTATGTDPGTSTIRVSEDGDSSVLMGYIRRDGTTHGMVVVTRRGNFSEKSLLIFSDAMILMGARV